MPFTQQVRQQNENGIWYPGSIVRSKGHSDLEDAFYRVESIAVAGMVNPISKENIELLKDVESFRVAYYNVIGCNTKNKWGEDITPTHECMRHDPEYDSLGACSDRDIMVHHARMQKGQYQIGCLVIWKSEEHDEDPEVWIVSKIKEPVEEEAADYEVIPIDHHRYAALATDNQQEPDAQHFRVANHHELIPYIHPDWSELSKKEQCAFHEQKIAGIIAARDHANSMETVFARMDALGFSQAQGNAKAVLPNHLPPNSPPGSVNVIMTNTTGDNEDDDVAHSTCRKNSQGVVLTVGPGYNKTATMYTAKGSGIQHDANAPPPEECFNCGGDHWRKDCPWGKSY